MTIMMLISKLIFVNDQATKICMRYQGLQCVGAYGYVLILNNCILLPNPTFMVQPLRAVLSDKLFVNVSIVLHTNLVYVCLHFIIFWFMSSIYPSSTLLQIHHRHVYAYV